jgi:transposase
MEKIDARTFSQEVQEAQRLQIVRLRKSGRTNNETAEIVGVSVFHSSKVWQRYQKQGKESLAKGTRGRTSW